MAYENRCEGWRSNRGQGGSAGERGGKNRNGVSGSRPWVHNVWGEVYGSTNGIQTCLIVRLTNTTAMFLG